MSEIDEPAGAGDAAGRGVSVVIPAFNEAGSIEDTVRRVADTMRAIPGWRSEILVVDDGSTDGTGERARGLPCRLVSHEVNLGYGAALKSGLRQAAMEYVLIVDADGTYPLEAIPKLLSETSGADMVVGARTGAKVEVPLLRRPGKWIITRLAEFLSNRSIPDLNSGLRVFRKAVAERFMPLFPEGFSFTTTITLALLTNGYRVAFVPIDYHKRVGKSSIRPVRDFIGFTILIIRICTYFKPLNVFVPPALAMMLLGALKGVRDYLVQGHLGLLGIAVLLTGIQLLFIGLLADLIDRRMKL